MNLIDTMPTNNVSGKQYVGQSLFSNQKFPVGTSTTVPVNSSLNQTTFAPHLNLVQTATSIPITKATTYQERLSVAISKMRNIVEREANQSGDFVRTRRRHFVDEDGAETDLTIFRVEGAPGKSLNLISDGLVDFLSTYEDVEICKDIAIEIL